MSARPMPIIAGRTEWAIVALIAAAAIALRVVNLGGWTLWLDESWSRWMTETDWAGLRARAAAYDTHPPVYYSVLKAWREIGGDGAFGMRLLSALAGAATVGLAWISARQVPALRERAWMPALAAALAAVSLPLIVASRQARPYALFALAFAAALSVALAILRRRDERMHAGLWIVYFTGLEAVLWLHSIGVLFAGALSGGLVLGLIAAGTLRRHSVPLVVGHIAAALAFFPGVAVILEHRRNWTTGWLRFDIANVPDGLAAGLAIPGPIAIPLFALAAVGAVAALRSRDDRPAALLLVSAAAVPAAAAILVSIVSTPVFLPRTLVPSVVPLMLLAAAGAGSAGSARIKHAAAALCLILSATISVTALSRGPEEKWRLIASALRASVAPGEEVWVVPNEYALPLRYANGGTAPYRVRGVPADFPAPAHPGPRPSGTRAVPGVTAADAQRLVADARRRGVSGLWVVRNPSRTFDPDDALRAALGDPIPRPGPSPGPNPFAPLRVKHYRLNPPAA